jgi:hypothetical protein
VQQEGFVSVNKNPEPMGTRYFLTKAGELLITREMVQRMERLIEDGEDIHNFSRPGPGVDAVEDGRNQHIRVARLDGERLHVVGTDENLLKLLVWINPAGYNMSDVPVWASSDPVPHTAANRAEFGPLDMLWKKRSRVMRPAVTCTLSSKHRRQRRRELQLPLRERMLTADTLPDGYLFTFPSWPAIWIDLAHLVALERQCCRFLDFQMELRSEERAIHLRITGPPEAKEIIGSLFLA